MFPGEYFIGVLGNRESSTFLVGGVPADGIPIASHHEMGLLCNGGIIGTCTSSRSWLKGDAMRVAVIGILETEEGQLNVGALGVPAVEDVEVCAPIVIVCGSSSETGKTWISANLISAMKRQGHVVASTKVTGTGRLKDILQHRDAGSDLSIDFPDVGLPSTYTDPTRFRKAVRTMFHRLQSIGPDVVVAEMGGDVIWANGPTFLLDSQIAKRIVFAIIAANDVMGAIACATTLREHNVKCRTWIALPLRNNEGSRHRIRATLGNECFDTMSREDYEACGREVAAIVE